MSKRLRIFWGASFVFLIVALFVFERVAALPFTRLLSLSYFGTTTRASVNSLGEEGNGGSEDPDISADGRYIVFESIADNLGTPDYNKVNDIFLHDQETGLTNTITAGNNGSHDAAISANGRYTIFYSNADNLVANDTNDEPDIFLYDRETGITELISVNSSGEQGNGSSYLDSAISADGRFVAFTSVSSNLVPNDTNQQFDIFVRDQQMGLTERVSINSMGQEGNDLSFSPDISLDGRFVVFQSKASNLIDNDNNNVYDIFVHDRQTGLTALVSTSTTGEPGNDHSLAPQIAADGRYLVFSSDASNLIENDTNQARDIFVHDLWTKATERVSVSSEGEQSNGNSGGVSVSADGRFIVFNSLATNLVISDTNNLGDIFRHDRLTGVTERGSLNSIGEQGNNLSFAPAITANGRYIAFQSGATNLVPDDTNDTYDIFVRDQPFATLDSNYPGGAPGSYFTLSGNYFPPTSTATITVNGLTLGDVATDDNGNATFLLHTSDADPGLYTVRLTVAPYWAESQLILHPANDTHPQEGSGAIFELPAGVAHHLLYLPNLTMNH